MLYRMSDRMPEEICHIYIYFQMVCQKLCQTSVSGGGITRRKEFGFLVFLARISAVSTSFSAPKDQTITQPPSHQSTIGRQSHLISDAEGVLPWCPNSSGETKIAVGLGDLVGPCGCGMVLSQRYGNMIYKWWVFHVCVNFPAAIPTLC